MLEKPDLQDGDLVACLQAEYGLQIAAIAFLPVGADRDAAVYRAIATDETPYFVKLKRGAFDEMAVAIPKFLHDQGIRQIIAPLATQSGQLWAELGDFKVILYPFVEGHNGFQSALTDRQWIDFGAALKAIHSVTLPPALMNRIQTEHFSGRWREVVRAFQAQIAKEEFSDPIAVELAAFLRSKQAQIDFLVGQAEQLGLALQSHPPKFVLCHSDIHAGNLLIDKNDHFYMVDWDNPILAPKERDLMFAGGGQFGAARTADEEERPFYQGYGQTEIDPIALAYYRYERIVEDLAAYSEQLFLTDKGGEDRKDALRRVTGQFLPNQVIEIAMRVEKYLPPEFQFRQRAQ